jgi:hypothetical protein
MTVSNASDCLTWNAQSHLDGNDRAVRVIPTNESMHPLGPRDIQPPVDLVDASRQLPYRRSSASVAEHEFNFLFPDHSSNMRAPFQTNIVTTFTRIFHQQIQRLGNEIDRSLAAIRHGDDEMCREAEQRLAFLIYVLGEPGLYGAKRALDRRSAEDDDSDALLQVIARSVSPDSLRDVTNVISQYLRADDARMRYSAAEALTRLGSEETRSILRQALKDENNVSVKRLMEAAVRGK